jgi:type I restriction enzyme R subunit
MTEGPEYRLVESPFLDQLTGLGWKFIDGSTEHPSVTGRDTFRDIFIKDDLKRALRRINLRNGLPWLDDARIAQAISELERIGTPRLLEGNETATKLLLNGTSVDGLPDWDGGRSQSVHYIDWARPDQNVFTAVRQFRVDCPGGMAKRFIIPDIALFINGIPVVIVECKSPTVPEAIAQAIDQLRRYHNARKAADEVEDNEGNERLFYTNQLLIATTYDSARLGTIGADTQHYLEWKDTAPVPLTAVQAELGDKQNLSSQERMIAGVLRPAHLLDLLRHFTLFQEVDGKTIKIVARYQQFRAVHRAIDRLRSGKTRRQDGESDRRGGIIWHTQGSGKSLTMMFLVRKLRSSPELRRFKVVVVTDRKDLERQLADTASLTGEVVQIAKKVAQVKKMLRVRGPGLIFAMIQKYADPDLEKLKPDDEVGDLGVLDDDDAVLVLVDEAHRSHTNTQHAHLLQALPNAARIGFTGTPILMGAKKRTTAIFGEELDRYTIRQSEADGATVPILYEGRTADGAVADGRDLDQLFEDMFVEHTDAEIEAIKRKYAVTGAILEAPKLIAAKARDILRHYVQQILPNGHKAQVVAYSRRAAVTYQLKFVEARDELVSEAEALDPTTAALSDEALASKPAKLRAAVSAARVLERLKSLEFAAVISPLNNDPGEMKEWTDPAKIISRIARFKRPFEHKDPNKCDPLAFLIVKSMLLTGFDAPIEGAMYIDRSLREADLLQALARVNRTHKAKTAGIIVDYYGVALHLKEALQAYDARDIEGALQSIRDEIPKLADQHTRVLALFTSRGLDPRTQDAECVHLLRDERLRAEFAVKLKILLGTYDLILPRPEALPYVHDVELFAELYTRAQRLYRDDAVALSEGIGRKVQKLIDDHIISLGIDPKIPPISITDAKFAAHVARQVSSRAKASEMEHAIRSHIRKNLDQDPVHYQRLSERLEELLEKFGENWEQLAMALHDFVEEARKGRTADPGVAGVDGIDTKLHAPFLDLLRQAREKQTAVNGDDLRWLAGLCVALVELIREQVRLVGFWKNPVHQEELRGQVFMFLDDHEIVGFEHAAELADRLMELAKANHARIAAA